MVAHVFGSRSTRFASRSAVGSETQTDIDAPRIPCVHACVVWSAKKLIIDLEIAFLPLYLLFKAVEIGKLVKDTVCRYFVLFSRKQRWRMNRHVIVNRTPIE